MRHLQQPTKLSDLKLAEVGADVYEVLSKHLDENDHPPLCGQYCLAMMLGITVKQACHMSGHAGAMCKDDIIEMLERIGCIAAWERGPQIRYSPNPVLVHIGFMSLDSSHWVIFKDNTFYDPAKEKPGWFYGNEAHIIGYIVIDKMPRWVNRL